jgi:hypothetical protein
MQAIRRTRRGATVLEVLVALSLFAVVALAGSWVFSATFRAWIAGRDLADEQQNARLVLEWMVRRIRLAGLNVTSTAEYFGEATATSVAFLADVDGDGAPEWHRFCLEPTEGVVRMETGAVSPGCTPTTGVPLTSRGVRPPRVLTLQFAYYDGRQSALAPLPLAAQQRPGIARVRVTLRIDSNRSGALDAGDLTITMDAIVRNYGG